MIRRAAPKVSHTALAKTLAMLQSGTVTAYSISSEVGVHLITAQHWLRTLKEEGTVHISGWLQDTLGRDCTPVYSMGAGEDVPRKSKSRAEVMRAYRQRRQEQT